ncbi:Uncharacterised protein [Porphyromonas cangingivalis]|uniref:Uncharacterized protein n=1 Tax=Porphyromonas cangingivalis TaxID=36874 RepID=A0A1T4MYF6_PORCN|nr:hypothetical protein SAMN02745205_01717 [Porphyromonas cangingivalis]VEJ04192.1 Uncharacterised protein [Porphyromonas cangingivalis]
MTKVVRLVSSNLTTFHRPSYDSFCADGVSGSGVLRGSTFFFYSGGNMIFARIDRDLRSVFMIDKQILWK